MVARAADVDPLIKREALGRLLATYVPAFRAHLVGRKRIRAEEADDLLQGFICDQIVADDLIARADRARGRFRGFVLVALDRYVARVRRADRAEKRSPETPVLQMEHAELAPDRTDAADAFDVSWAREVVEQAIGQMQRRCERGGQQRVWEIFRACTLAPLLESAPQPAYGELVQRFGLSSPQQVSNLLVTGKRLFARMLRQVIGEYAGDENEIENELRDLWSILSGGQGAGVSIDRT